MIVSWYVPGVADDGTPTVSVDALDAGFGVKTTPEPAGWPERLNVTLPEKPLSDVIVTW